jgi:hypothetical protein
MACDNSLTKEEKQQYTVKGKEIAQATFKDLSTNLKGQMKAGGPSKAIPFCNEQAMPITQKLSQQFDVSIKRTSNKIRNSKNNPTARETEIISEYSKMLANNKKLAPIVEIDENNEKHFYAPIVLKSKCLACHGKLNENVSVKTDSIIKSYYPNDKATGYAEGDLRGIWSVTFKK